MYRFDDRNNVVNSTFLAITDSMVGVALESDWTLFYNRTRTDKELVIRIYHYDGSRSEYAFDLTDLQRLFREAGIL